MGSLTHRDGADQPELSIVIPMRNEEEVLDRLFATLERVLEDNQISYEIVCVNDGSSDRTLELLLRHRRRNPAIVVLDLSRNFGKEVALAAGLNHAEGRAVIPLDADLQDPPELIPEFLDAWRRGAEVVVGVRRSRPGDSWAKRKTAAAFYRLYNLLCDIDMPANAGDFRLMDRKVVEALKRIGERNRFNKGLFAWVGFRQKRIEYDRPERVAGTTKWNYWKLWNFALDGLTAFTTAPLRLWSYVGAAISALAILYAIFIVIRAIAGGADLPGYSSLMAAILFLGGVQLISLGIIGEYLGRLFLEAKGRPLYVLRDIHGRVREPGRRAA